MTAAPDLRRPMLDAALAYARRGWAVFPCAPSKAPLEAGKGKGVLLATTDEQTITGWWTRWPNALIGLAAGRSGLVILDVDTKRGDGWASLAEVQRELGPLPSTYRVRTPSLGPDGEPAEQPGAHLYYLAPEGVEIRPSAGKVAPHVDVRAAESYVIAPPSAGYVVIYDAALAELPPAWVERLRAPERAEREAPRERPRTTSADQIERRAIAYVDRMPAAISRQGGHDAAFAVALALVQGFDLPPHVARRIFADHYNPRCKPPWSEREMDHKIASADNASQVSRGYLLEADRLDRERAEVRAMYTDDGAPPHTDEDAPGAAASKADNVSNGPPAPDPLGVAPTLASAYTLEDLTADRERGLLAIDTLPPWPRETGHHEAHAETGHGLGRELHELLGYGLAPGECIGFGASAAGAGKTYFMMQIADGLALRNVRAEAGPRTPVLLISEMGVRPLTWRSLARWTGASARIYRAGTSAPQDVYTENAWTLARRALDPNEHGPFGDFGRARSWIRCMRTDGASGPLLIERARVAVSRWRDELRTDALPIVILDPVQRFQGEGNEVEALNATAEALHEATEREGWISMFASDTNKPNATGKGDEKTERERGASMIRGSYKLQHVPSAVLALNRASDPDESGYVDLHIIVVKNRWGSAAPPWPLVRWHTPTGRMIPSGLVTAGEREDGKSEQVYEALSLAADWVSTRSVQEAVGGKWAAVVGALEALEAEERVRRRGGGAGKAIEWRAI